MCSWCYAFRESWDALQKCLPTNIQVIYILGGLAPDTEQPMPETMRDMIQQTWRKIEKMLPEVRFNHDFWMHNIPIRSTYPACRAILAARKQTEIAEIKMLQAIQHAYYQKAKNPSLAQTLVECAAEIGLDTTIFASDLFSDDIDEALKQELWMTAKLNAYSFPSLRLINENRLYSIAIDYLDYEKMLNEINAVIGNNASQS